MVLLSSENPRKMGFLPCISHAANEHSLFTHSHLLAPVLLKATAMSSRVQMHQQAGAPSPPPRPLPKGSAWLQPSLLGPFADTACARPSSRVTEAHSALSPSLLQILPKAAFKSLQYGVFHVGRGPLQDSPFPFMIILALKPPGIRIRKKSSVSRNDSSWV